MKMTSEVNGEIQIVTVDESRIDAAAAIQFKETMRELTAQAQCPVVLNLENVEFIDSSGLGAIVATMKQLGSERPLHLSGLTPIVAKVFALTRMEKVFRIFADPQEAVQSYEAKRA